MSKIVPAFLIASTLVFAYIIASWSPASTASPLPPRSSPNVVQAPQATPAAQPIELNQQLPPR